MLSRVDGERESVQSVPPAALYVNVLEFQQ
jgi:hypothetical protein